MHGPGREGSTHVNAAVLFAGRYVQSPSAVGPFVVEERSDGRTRTQYVLPGTIVGVSAETEAGLGNGLTLFQLEPSGDHEVVAVVLTQCSFIECVQLHAPSSNGVTSTW